MKLWRWFRIGLWAAIPWIVMAFWSLFIFAFTHNVSDFTEKACKLPAVAETIQFGCFEFWLNRYQTLIVGSVGVLVAWLTIDAMRDQTREAAASGRRLEVENENALRKIISTRTALIAEFWKAIDWALSAEDSAIKNKRAEIANAPVWHTGEERDAFKNMELLAAGITPLRKPQMNMVLLRWREMLDFLDSTLEEHREKNRDYDFAHKMWLLRIKYSFILLELERFDPRLLAPFVGCFEAGINPGNTPERQRAVFESTKRRQEEAEAARDSNNAV